MKQFCLIVIMCSQTDQISPGGYIKDVYNVTICMFPQYTENLAKKFDVRSSSMCLAVGRGFRRVLVFPPQIKLTATI